MTKPRLVICSGCGQRERLVADEPGKFVQLPDGWKRVGMGRDSRVIVYCAECYRAEVYKAVRDRSGP